MARKQRGRERRREGGRGGHGAGGPQDLKIQKDGNEKKEKGQEKQKGDTYSEYNSKSCSPESPIRKNLEPGNESIMSCTPARLRVAGADSKPLKIERPAYDLSFIDP